jgi:hypothetical protein
MARLTLPAGQHVQQASFGITNQYAAPITLRFSFTDAVTAPGDTHTAASELSITPRDVTIAPGQQAKPTITLSDSDALAPGSQQINLLVTQTAAPGENVSIVPSFRMPLTIIKEAGAVTALNAGAVSKPGFAVHLPGSASLAIRNTGNVVAIPHGYVSLQDPRGREISKSALNTASTAVLPGAQLHLTAGLTPLGHAWLPGTYRLVASYGVGGGAAAKTVTAHFLYVPLWELLLIPLLGAILYCSRQAWHTWRLRRKPQTKPSGFSKRPLSARRVA